MSENMDIQFTKALQEYMAIEEGKRDIAVGAQMLLQLNRNTILYRNILAAPAVLSKTLFYELDKHLRIRLDGYTREEVAQLEQQILPNVLVEAEEREEAERGGEMMVAAYRGKRDDHETLPDEIKALWEENGKLYERKKELYNELLSLYDKEPCDRYDLLKLYNAVDAKYRANLEVYDHFDVETTTESTDESNTESTDTEDGSKRSKRVKN